MAQAGGYEHEAIPVAQPYNGYPPKADQQHQQQAPGLIPGQAAPVTAFNVHYQQGYPAAKWQANAQGWQQGVAQYPAQQVYPGGVYNASSGAPDPASQGCCVTPDWIFFGVGWVFPILWWIGALLPLCRTPSFKNKTVRGGWIANCIMTVLWIVAIIAIIVASTKGNGGSGNGGSGNGGSSNDLQTPCVNSLDCNRSEYCRCNSGASTCSTPVCCLGVGYSSCRTNEDCCDSYSCSSAGICR